MKKNDQKGTKIQVKKPNFEMKKPSELCQIIFFSDFRKNEHANLSPLQIDLLNTVFYLISDVLLQNELSPEELYNWSSINHFEINLQTITNMLGKYDNHYYEPIVQNLQELSKVQVLTNTLHKNKSTECSLFHLIRKINWVKDKHTSNKRVKVWVEPELLTMFYNIEKMYTTYHLQIQYALTSKYSKLLYDVLKDYSNLGYITIDFSILKALLNIDVKEKPLLDQWAIFNRDVLKRSVAEISEKSDVFITYTPIKERLDKKLEVTKVKFNIKKQKSILVDYDIEAKFDSDTTIVSDNKPILTESSTPVEMKYKEIAYKKMENAKVFGTKIQNESRYVTSIIEQMKKDNINVVGMVELDYIITDIKEFFMEYKELGTHQLIVLDNYDKKIPVVSISSDYLLFSPVDRVNITQTIEETINKINTFKNKGGEFKLIQTPGYVEDLSISYL